MISPNMRIDLDKEVMLDICDARKDRSGDYSIGKAAGDRSSSETGRQHRKHEGMVFGEFEMVQLQLKFQNIVIESLLVCAVRKRSSQVVLVLVHNGCCDQRGQLLFCQPSVMW